MNRLILLIGIGSFIGGVSRYYAQQIVTRFLPSPLPYGTLLVNVTGCFLIGLILGIGNRGNMLSPEWRMFLATGFCGGFTTFSTFSYESINLIQDGEFLTVAVYLVLSVILGLAFTYLGLVIVKSI